MDAFNDLSFNYSREKDVFQFVLYYTKESIGNKEFPTLESLQIYRTLNYLKKNRKLNESQIKVMKHLYEIKGYKILSERIKRKIDNHLYGEDYIKAVFKLLEKTKG